MNKKTLISFVALGMLVTACTLPSTSSSSSSSNSTNQNTSSNTSSSSSSSSGLNSSSSKVDLSLNYDLKNPDLSTPIRSRKAEFTSDDFFNLGNTVLINVDISNEELLKLQDDYETGLKSEIYRRADKVTIDIINNGKTHSWEFKNVGIRQKGNTSRNSIFNRDGVTLNQNHYKLSFDETFTNTSIYDASYIKQYGNKLNETREFLGMSGIDIKWDKNYDSTHIREAYSSYLFNAAGIITPRVGLSKMVFNYGDRSYDFGLCVTFEKASKSLIKRYLQEENVVTMTNWDDEKIGTFGVPKENYGDLYKCSYGVGQGGSNGADMTTNSISGKRVGVGNINGSYIPTYERKTATEIEYNDGLLKNMINTINNSSSIENINEVVDLEYLAIEEAVAYIVGNPDAMRYNYNNYMIYLRRTDGKAIIIPIDNDRCFGITKDWNVRNGLMYDTVLSPTPSNENNQRNPLLNKVLFGADNEYKQLYVDYVNKLMKSDWVKNETFEAFYNKAYNSYFSYKKDSEEFGLNGTHNISFATYMESKLNLENNSDVTISNEYNNLYIVGTFNNWGEYSSSELSLYKMQHLGDGLYKVEVLIKKVEKDEKGNYIKFKFNNGYNDYSQIDWTLSSDLTTLNKSVGKSVYLYDVNVNDVLTVMINVNTNEVIVEID